MEVKKKSTLVISENDEDQKASFDLSGAGDKICKQPDCLN